MENISMVGQSSPVYALTMLPNGERWLLRVYAWKAKEDGSDDGIVVGMVKEVNCHGDHTPYLIKAADLENFIEYVEGEYWDAMYAEQNREDFESYADISSERSRKAKI